MPDASRVLAFRVPPQRYTVAGIFSVTVHGVLVLSALVWAQETLWLEPLRGPLERRQPDPLRYVLLLPSPPGPVDARLDSAATSVHRLGATSRVAGPRQEVQAPLPAEPEPPMTGAVVTASLAEPSSDGWGPPVQTHEIGPGEVASIAGAGSAPIKYARLDQRDKIRVGDIDVEQPDGNASAGEGDRLGNSRVAELVGPAAAACPALRRAGSEQHQQVIVSIGFEVDANGAVDPGTLHVVQSPAKPQTEHRLYAHMYAVAIGTKVDREMPAAEQLYDSVVTRDVRQHVAALRFRPALRGGLPIRSSVLVSCQSP